MQQNNLSDFFLQKLPREGTYLMLVFSYIFFTWENHKKTVEVFGHAEMKRYYREKKENKQKTGGTHWAYGDPEVHFLRSTKDE